MAVRMRSTRWKAALCLTGMPAITFDYLRRSSRGLFSRRGHAARRSNDLMKNVFEYTEELQRLGRTEDALTEYGDLFDANLGGVEPLLRRSELFRKLGLLSEARADLERAAEIETRNGWPLLRLAQMAHSLGKPLLAAAYVQEALNRQPEAPEIRINAAAIFRSLDWLDRAFDVVRLLPRDMTDWWGDMRRDAETFYRDQHAQTLAKLGRPRRTANEAIALWRLSSELFKLGKLRIARKLCEARMREDPASFAAFEVYARIVARERGPSEAVSFLRAVAFLHGGTSEHAQALAWMENQTPVR
jgi:tetratricopeptide (TPR) repeat protein